MSFVSPESGALARATSRLQGIRSAAAARNAAVAAPTTGVIPAAADEVSAMIAAQFATHAVNYQAVSVQAEAMHAMLANLLGAGLGPSEVADAADADDAC